MQSDHETHSVARIEAARAINRQAAELCTKHGLTSEERAIAALYSAFDLAEHHAGQGLAAIEWLRTGCDILERGLMDGLARRP